MKKFVLGDIHGAYKALVQCFERSAIDVEHDQLIFLGDVSDRGPQTVECVDLLLKVKNLIALMGNHDLWTRDWLSGNVFDQELWFRNGGYATYNSYSTPSDFEELKSRHLSKYYEHLQPFYNDGFGHVFVHAGFDINGPIEESTPEHYYWDRTLFKSAVHFHSVNPATAFPNNEPYHEIYIGHTPTHRLPEEFDRTKPIKLCNVWCMDQGAGWGEHLSMMDIETKEIFQSDRVSDLYI